jgi:hypothetical protein
VVNFSSVITTKDIKCVPENGGHIKHMIYWGRGLSGSVRGCVSFTQIHGRPFIKFNIWQHFVCHLSI